MKLNSKILTSFALLGLIQYSLRPGGAVAQEQFTQRTIFIHGSRTEKKIALTFDACSPRRHTGFDQEIFAILEKTNTPATLFLGGRWMEEYPAATRRFSSSVLFEVGNHTYSHRHLTTTSLDSMKLEIDHTQKVYERITGKRCVLFRPPFGEFNDTVLAVAANRHLLPVLYDLASGDPDTTFSKARLIRSVVGNIRNGSIIVMHMNGRGWHTAEALPDIIGQLRAKGFTFVKVSELTRE